MPRFCTKCGKELMDGEKCSCQPTGVDTTNLISNITNTLLSKMGILGNNEKISSFMEPNSSIVPDAIKANDGEIPIKQYDVATLRSRIKGNYAKGKLQVTNKRVLFRAPGFSYKGRILVQHEFSIDEIAGIEIQKNNRLSFMNVCLSIILAFVVCPVFANFFNQISYEAEVLSLISSIILGIACAIPFFIIKKRFWIKMLIMNCGFGSLLGTAGIAKISTYSIFSGININIADIVGIAVLCLWLLNMILVSIVPDLTLCIKTKGASEAINIRRRHPATFFKQEIEYTGFSEVVPGKDIDIFSQEIGALIDDVQTFGDAGIEKWKV